MDQLVVCLVGEPVQLHDGASQVVVLVRIREQRHRSGDTSVWVWSNATRCWAESVTGRRYRPHVVHIGHASMMSARADAMAPQSSGGRGALTAIDPTPPRG